MARRFAIYAAPRADGALWQVANAWLGRDPASGAALARSALAGFSAARCAEITEAPRHYGFHATLNPPFRMAPGCREAALIAALAAFARERTAIVLPPLAVTALGGFLALTCTRACPEIDRLAEDCLRRFDRFRSPMDGAERADSRPSGLTGAQERNLAQWGYPYVLEAFRFHMTLTGRLAAEERARAAAALADLFATAGLCSVTLDGICLFEQDTTDSPFLLRQRFAFA